MRRFVGLSHCLGTAIVLAISLVLLMPRSPAEADSIVDFPDPSLRAAIRSAIAKPSGDIYQSDLLGLYMLDVRDKNVTSLAGLEHCTSLTELYLERNQISDISPLASLTGLRQLLLRLDEVSDISPLASLVNLTWLNLQGNQIGDISALSSLSALETLYLPSNRISDISPLAGLSSLTYLDLSYNDILDISALDGLTGLTSLVMTNSQTRDISPLANLNNLRGLNLSYDEIRDISPLANLTSLEGLALAYNQISDISALTNLTGLYSLNLEYNQVADISPLVANAGIGLGDLVGLAGNPLGSTSVNTHVPALEARGVIVSWSDPGQAPAKPQNISPANGAAGVSVAPTLRVSAFSDPDTGDTHAATQWQITVTTDNYSSRVFDSGVDTANLTEITVPALGYSGTFCWHARYQDNRGAWSEWSTETSFATLTTAPVTADITSDGGIVETENGYIAVQFQTGAVDTVATVTITQVPVSSAAASPRGFKSGSTCFTVEAVDGSGDIITSFAVPLIITVKYTEEDVEAAGGDPRELVLAYFNEQSEEWLALETTLNTQEMTVSATTTHLSQWAILGKTAAGSSGLPALLWAAIGVAALVALGIAAYLVNYRLRRKP